jgi:hypothetical protein
MAGPFDFTGQNIEDTYQRVLQTDGTNIYDGTGSLFTLPGVSRIIPGGGIVISPTSGEGEVTIASTAATYNTATGSYGSFYDTGSYTIASPTTIYSMSLSTTSITNGVYISGSDRTKIYFTNAGIYDLQFSAQFENSDTIGADVNVWIRQGNGNGIPSDVIDSDSQITVPPFKGSTDGKIIAAWNFFVSANANDYVQLAYAGATTITLKTNPAGVTPPIHPLIPSLIVTANRIDTLLSNTGSFSGSFTGELIGTASFATNSLTASFIDGGTF